MFRRSSPAALRGLKATTNPALLVSQTSTLPLQFHSILATRGNAAENVAQGGTAKKFAFSQEHYDPLAAKKETEKVKIRLNDQEIEVRKGSTIIEACRQMKAYVPTLCYHPMLTIVGQCRLCLVQLRNKNNKLVTACSTAVEEGMDIITDSEPIQSSVLNSLSLLRCRHPNACMTCEADGHCEFQNLVYRFKVEELLPQYHRERSTVKDTSSNAVVRDMAKCVLCSRCIRACSHVQGMNILGMVGRGSNEQVTTFAGLPLNSTACISCGQCTAVCPVGALIEKPHIHHVQRGLKNKHGKIYVAHTAPAVRVAISEEFGMAPGSVSTGKLVAALKELGFDYVFDTNFTADLTIMEEGYEFIKRVTQGGVLPMFTSCCPGWINLVEKTYPRLLPHLSTCKSPQAMMGTLIKTFFAKKLGVDPTQIVNVSIMPCVAKKDEMARPQLTSEVHNPDGSTKRIPDTDYVLTTREIGHLIERERIPFVSLPDKDYDSPLGITTGAAALFGATGGVLEAALRTAAEVLTGKSLEKVDFHAVRGYESVRTATVKVGDLDVNCAIVHGTARIREVVEAVLKGDKSFHIIEVMACPGGCVGGGGEPKTSAVDPDVLKKRIDAIYAIDAKQTLRQSHKNPAVQELYRDFLQGEPNSPKSHRLLHTHYTDRTSEVKGRTDIPFGLPSSMEILDADSAHGH